MVLLLACALPLAGCRGGKGSQFIQILIRLISGMAGRPSGTMTFPPARQLFPTSPLPTGPSRVNPGQTVGPAGAPVGGLPGVDAGSGTRIYRVKGTAFEPMKLAGGRKNGRYCDPNGDNYLQANEVGVALPSRSALCRHVTVRYKGRMVKAIVLDVGPWNTNDPYWARTGRPQAETGIDMRGRRTNKGGIDLTWAAVRVVDPGADVKTWSGMVEWWWSDGAGVPVS